jgi:hypothetical protein
MNSVQKQLVNVLLEVAHPNIGVIPRIRSGNQSLLRSMAAKAQQIDALLGRLEKQVWAIWLPVVTGAALAIGFALGTWFANERQAALGTPGTVQSQQGLRALQMHDPRWFRSGVQSTIDRRSIDQYRKGSRRTFCQTHGQSHLRDRAISKGLS